MKIENDGSFTAHINEVPIWFAIKALASSVQKLDVKDPKTKIETVEALERYANHVRETHGNI